MAIEGICGFPAVLIDGVQLPGIAGSNPAVRCKTYRQWIGFVLRDTKERCTEARLSCARTLDLEYRHHAVAGDGQSSSLAAMQKRALPESGYRVFRIGAKGYFFRTATGALKPSAAAFASMITGSGERQK